MFLARASTVDHDHHALTVAERHTGTDDALPGVRGDAALDHLAHSSNSAECSQNPPSPRFLCRWDSQTTRQILRWGPGPIGRFSSRRRLCADTQRARVRPRSRRYGSSHGGSFSSVPRSPSGSSTSKPGFTVAISNRPRPAPGNRSTGNTADPGPRWRATQRNNSSRILSWSSWSAPQRRRDARCRGRFVPRPHLALRESRRSSPARRL